MISVAGRQDLTRILIQRIWEGNVIQVARLFAAGTLRTFSISQTIPIDLVNRKIDIDIM